MLRQECGTNLASNLLPRPVVRETSPSVLIRDNKPVDWVIDI